MARQLFIFSKTFLVTAIFILFFAFPLTTYGNELLNNSQTKIIDYCELFRSPEIYDKKTVRVRAIYVFNNEVRVDGGTPFYYSDRCNSADYFSTYNDEYSFPVKVSPQAKAFLDAIENRKKKGTHRVYVIVKGVFEAPKGQRYGHLGSFRVGFSVQEIESAKSVDKKFSAPDWNAPAPLFESESAVQTLNTDFMFYFSGSKRETFWNWDEVIAPNFLLTDISGKVINKLDFMKQIFSNLTGRTAVNSRYINIENSYAEISGCVEIKGSGANDKLFSYANSFKKNNSEWQIVSMKLNTEKCEKLIH